MFKTIPFRPLPGLASPHLQMLFATYSLAGQEPPSQRLKVSLNDGDQLGCELSSPPTWRPDDDTIVLLHGLGGSHLSSYMIRMARKFYQRGLRVVRVNLRGCGSGRGLNSLPYNSGNSQDIFAVLQLLKAQQPHSSLHIFGFSLGGNIILKMAGELGEHAVPYVESMTAICPALDLWHSVEVITKRVNRLYHRYYLKNILKQGEKWVKGHIITSIHEMDEKVTAPLWGYANATDYYEKCSSWRFIPDIRVPCRLLFSADDPFIDYTILKRVALSSTTSAWLTSRGAHMGFIGRREKGQGIFWMDEQLLDWHSTWSQDQGARTASIS